MYIPELSSVSHLMLTTFSHSFQEALVRADATDSPILPLTLGMGRDKKIVNKAKGSLDLLGITSTFHRMKDLEVITVHECMHLSFCLPHCSDGEFPCHGLLVQG